MRLIASLVLVAAAHVAIAAADSLDDNALRARAVEVFNKLSEDGFNPSTSYPADRYEKEVATLDDAIAHAANPSGPGAAQVWMIRAVILESEGRAADLTKQVDEAAAKKLPDELVQRLRGMAKGAAIQPGTAAPDFAITDTTGKEHKLADYHGKVLLLDFWATWCGPCVAEMPNVKAIYDQFHDRGFEVLGVSLDEERDRLDQFLAKKDIPWPQYFDGKGWSNQIALAFGVLSIPAPFVIGPDGKVIAKGLKGDELKQAIEKALPAK